MSNSKRNGRRGFTIAELVVALAIIVIVSATAVAIVNSQNTIYLRTVQTTEATNMAENAVECFRFANGDAAKFEAAYELSLNGTDLVDNTDNEKTDYTFEKSNMTVTITIEGDTLTFLAKDGEKEILKESYTYTR